jgi:putative FmdB family regulatory protein
VPLYEYECRDHGVFEAQRSIAESGQDGVCEVCLRGAPRIVSAPNLGQMARSQVKAFERNERSRYEPKVVHTEPRRAGERTPLRAAGGTPWAIGHG